MKSELIIDAQPQEVTIALLEDQRLVEFQKEGLNTAYSVGNIYAARVKKIMPGLNACFVEVGHEREAFLHYQDLGVQFLSIEKSIQTRWRCQPDSSSTHLSASSVIPIISIASSTAS